MAKNEVRIGVGVSGARGAANDLDRIRDKFTKLQAQSGKSLLAGFAGGAAVAGIGLASQALGQLTDVIGDSIQAAREEEVSIQKLGTSLRANIPAWDGNTAAIERTLKARMKLGFSDDEQRDSLARIVVATKDVNKALEVQRTAMDLARLKGISLAEAGDALIKVEGGQFRALKALGIQLPKNATATQALAAVQKAAAGQAEDFAKTNEGKLLVSQVKVGEAMEKFGGAILPAVSEAMIAASNVASDYGNVLDGLTHLTDVAAGKQEDFGESLLNLARGAFLPLDLTARAVGAAVDGLGIKFNLGGVNSTDYAEKLKGSAVEVTGAFKPMEDAATDWRDKYADVAGDIIRRSHRVRDALVKDAAIVRGEVFDETEVRADLHDQRLALFALEEERRSAKTAEARRQASDDIVQALDDEGAALEELASIGKLTDKDVDRFAKDAKKNFDSLSKEGREDIQALIDKYRALAKMPNISKTFTITKETRSGTPGRPAGRGETEFAKGGRVPGPKGAPVEATVHGGEFVVSNEMQRAMGSTPAGVMAGGGATYNVYVTAGIGTSFSAAEGRRLADAILPALAAGMQRRGMLPRTATGLTG